MIHSHPGFWQNLEQFVSSSQIVVDRPKHSVHPRQEDLIYPLDYGFLQGTSAGDGEGIDVWLGSSGSRELTGIINTADPEKRDAELKLLLGCSSEDVEAIKHFYNATANMPCLILERGAL
jgi:inorganic pyrophosphatase